MPTCKPKLQFPLLNRRWFIISKKKCYVSKRDRIPQQRVLHFLIPQSATIGDYFVPAARSASMLCFSMPRKGMKSDVID